MGGNSWRAEVEGARDAEATRRCAQIEHDIAEMGDLEAWLSQASALPPGLAPHLEAERMAVALRIAERLGSWLAMGGGLTLTTPPRTSDAAEATATPDPAPPRAVPPPNRTTDAPNRVESPHRHEPPARIDALPAVVEAKAAEVPPAEPRVAATLDALASLKQRLESGAPFDEPSAGAWMARLDQVVPPLLDALDDEREIARLRTTIGACDVWSVFPHDIQRMLIGLSATRLRMLQDERFVESRRLDGLFSQLTAYSARERPGSVHGLARGHRPFRDTWREDADAWTDRLRALLTADDDVPPSPSAQKTVDGLERLAREILTAPTAETQAAVRSQLVREVSLALRNGLSARNRSLVKLVAANADAFAGADFRALRRAVRDDAEAAEEEAGTGERAPIPEDWAWWTRTQGRRAVMVGGSPREINRARLEQTFHFATLEWEGTEFKRNSLQALRNRISSGGIDLVLVLRSFVGHDADQILLPACREHGIDWVHVEQGYGTARVRAAIERFLDP